MIAYFSRDDNRRFNSILGHGDRFLVPPLLSENSVFFFQARAAKTFIFVNVILIKFMFHHAVECRSVGGSLQAWLAQASTKGGLRKLRFLEGRLPGVRGEAGMAGRL